MSDYTVPIPLGFVWTYPAVVDRWIDGDTPVCHVRYSLDDEDGAVDVRVEGINALELHDRYGHEAQAAAERLCPPGTPVVLLHHARDKYGRLLADLILPGGERFSTLMLQQKASDGTTPLAVPYL